jgi:hypothetical protein
MIVAPDKSPSRKSRAFYPSFLLFCKPILHFVGGGISFCPRIEGEGAIAARKRLE